MNTTFVNFDIMSYQDVHWGEVFKRFYLEQKTNYEDYMFLLRTKKNITVKSRTTIWNWFKDKDFPINILIASLELWGVDPRTVPEFKKLNIVSESSAEYVSLKKYSDLQEEHLKTLKRLKEIEQENQAYELRIGKKTSTSSPSP